MATMVIVPGLGNSGPEHWQSLWTEKFGALRVEQEDWDAPDPESWAQALEETVAAAQGPVTLVAHSLGCAAIMIWLALGTDLADKVTGALLVAPPDVDSEVRTPEAVRGFAPMPLRRLPFPSIVVASGTDPYLSLPRAKVFAAAWGSRLVTLEDAGHINSAAGYGDWPQGEELVQSL